MSEGVAGKRAAGGEHQVRALGEGRVGALVQRPADKLPRCGFDPAVSAVFALEPVLHDLELQRAHRAEQRDPLERVGKLERLRDAFL